MVQTSVRKEIRMEEGYIVKTIYGILAALSFLYVLGVAGSLDLNMVSLGIGAIRMILGLGCFGIFCKLADILD